MTTRCSVVLVYDSNSCPKPTPLGLTDDKHMKVLVKRQLLREAEDALHGAEELGDSVLIADFQIALERLHKILDMLIPPELEELYIGGNGEGSVGG